MDKIPVTLDWIKSMVPICKKSETMDNLFQVLLEWAESAEDHIIRLKDKDNGKD